MTRRWRLVAVGVVAAGAVAAAVAAALAGGSKRPVAAPVAAATTTVVRTDLANHEELDGTLHHLELGAAVAAGRSGTLTAIAAEGSTVTAGQPLFWIDQSPVLLLHGAVPAYRDLVQGMRGADVRQLKATLAILGYAGWDELGDDDRFSAATASALRELQAAIGARATGVLRETDALFLPVAVRIGTHASTVGTEVTSGTEITAASGTTQVVTVDLPAAKTDRVSEGDAVEVELPSGATVAATVTTVSEVAEQEDAGTGEESEPTIEVTISLDDAADAGATDQAPVDVSITTETADDVLAVPVSALLALAEGGYGVELVQPEGTHRIVAVETGMFSDSEDLVEIRGDGVAEGDEVVIPR